MEKQNNLGKNLALLRKKFGYTQQYIADYLGVTSQAVTQYEKESRTIPVTFLRKLALLYNIEEYDLFNDNFESIAVSTAFSAFRATELSPKDLREVSKFKKIVTNYLNMVKALEKD